MARTWLAGSLVPYATTDMTVPSNGRLAQPKPTIKTVSPDLV